MEHRIHRDTLARVASRRDLSRDAGAVKHLLRDCLVLWGVKGRILADGGDVSVIMDEGAFVVRAASPDMRPVRWLLQTPPRRAANRPPRALPSIVALLSALRNALGAEGGNRLRIGTGGSVP